MGYNLIADYRKAQFSFSTVDTKVLDKILKDLKPTDEGKKICAIVDIPRNTAISMIVKAKFHPDLGYNTMIFTTEEAALAWMFE